MRLALKLFFIFLFICITCATLLASRDESILSALMRLEGDAWFQAALVDTYAAFLTIWLWIAWKERTWPRAFFWLVLILLTGTFAFSVYILIQLFRLPPQSPVRDILLRRQQEPGA